jgi:hypothetical protein
MERSVGLSPRSTGQVGMPRADVGRSRDNKLGRCNFSRFSRLMNKQPFTSRGEDSISVNNPKPNCITAEASKKNPSSSDCRLALVYNALFVMAKLIACSWLNNTTTSTVEEGALSAIVRD